MLIVYCKSHKRQPVYFGWRSPWRDRQGDIPSAWCELCGREVFSTEKRCIWCQDWKGVSE